MLWTCIMQMIKIINHVISHRVLSSSCACLGDTYPLYPGVVIFPQGTLVSSYVWSTFSHCSLVWPCTAMYFRAVYCLFLSPVPSLHLPALAESSIILKLSSKASSMSLLSPQPVPSSPHCYENSCLNALWMGAFASSHQCVCGQAPAPRGTFYLEHSSWRLICARTRIQLIRDVLWAFQIGGW